MNASSQKGRRILCDRKIIPLLGNLMGHSSVPIQFFSVTALANIAVDQYGRSIFASNHDRLIPKLISKCKNDDSQIASQSILCLRNLASDTFFQLRIVQKGALQVLLPLLSSSMSLFSVAALRNLSISVENESVRPPIEIIILGVELSAHCRCWLYTHTDFLGVQLCYTSRNLPTRFVLFAKYFRQ